MLNQITGVLKMLALRKTFKLCESSLLAGHRLADFQSKLVSRVRVSVKYLQQQIQSYDMNTVVHDFNGHGVNGIHVFNGKMCYDGPFVY